MLTPAAHVPHMLIGTVPGLGGTWAGVDLPADLLDHCTLWSSGPTGMAGADLDAEGIEALLVLLADAAARIRAAG